MPLKSSKSFIRRVGVLCVVLVANFAAVAQVSPYGRFITDTLASDAFKGRGYAENGHQLAADFIEAEFKKHGLSPLKGEYQQPFPMEVVRVNTPAFLQLNRKKLLPGKQFLIDPDS